MWVPQAASFLQRPVRLYLPKLAYLKAMAATAPSSLFIFWDNCKGRNFWDSVIVSNLKSGQGRDIFGIYKGGRAVKRKCSLLVREEQAGEEPFRCLIAVGKEKQKKREKMVALVARRGRELQRYSKDGSRLVVGCIPYRYGFDGWEVLVITSQKGQGMMFPKGGWESDESITDAVSREAMEEAGVEGEVEDGLGTWNFNSKSQIDRTKISIVFPMFVKKQLDLWPEKETRQRRWVSLGEARRNCQYSWMKEALKTLEERLLSSKAHEAAF